MMRLKTLVTTLLAAALLAAGLEAAPARDTRTWQQALRLYENGMYEQARILFAAMPDGPLTDAYEVLCSLKMQTDDYPELLTAYRLRYPSSRMSGVLHFEQGRILFDQRKYQQAASEFSFVHSADLSDSDLPEYIFKCGYSAFALGHYAEASQFFTLLESLPQSDYTAPGRYFTGIMLYENKQFAEAEANFWNASADPRFQALTDFYIVDCEFNQKNYEFAIREGTRIYDSLPAGRRERVARLLSESYLIRGDKDKAREYYDDLSHEGMNRKDYFYAGTVLYSVDDYAGAIENFTKMGDRAGGQLPPGQRLSAHARPGVGHEGLLRCLRGGFRPRDHGGRRLQLCQAGLRPEQGHLGLRALHRALVHQGARRPDLRLHGPGGACG